MLKDRKNALANVTTSSTRIVFEEAILFIEPLAACAEQCVVGESNP